MTDDRALAPADRTKALAQLADLADWTSDHLEDAKAPNTLRGYRADWSDFAACWRTAPAST